MKGKVFRLLSVFAAAAFALCGTALADIPSIPADESTGAFQTPLALITAVAIILIGVIAFIIRGNRRR